MFGATSAGSVLDNVVVRYGGNWFDQNVYVGTNSLVVRNSTISHAGPAGASLGGRLRCYAT